MSATALAALIAVTASYATSIWTLVHHLGNRLERIEDRLTRIEATLARIEQRLAPSR